ncbi:RagB/SusD family nutrient uptake outer membrane protein [Sphingobacterium sp. SYP-B4668]|uniref:RagB/SusD family nutrient uptake outer membrane protein n=1 Tax=Sphingobacterium sp. SYP-B4668 TaxID=2996035 RepID=UPI0022DE7EA8|nr:RagB/SusD family nutrient uptake outer membrane protein [Sphingobacterium sp. SYP-B4668]
MKTSIIIKKITKAALAVQLLFMATSCDDYLNIDTYFDDEFNIDSAYANTRYMEAYMWGAAALFPDESSTVRSNYTPGPMATDEGINGLTGTGTANIYYGMDFVTGNITPDYYGSGGTLNQWGKNYKIIRKCNNILKNIDVPRDMTYSDRNRIEGYTRFIRAYAYYNLILDFGPPILLGDEVINTNETIEYYDRPRATYDEAMNYICDEFEKAAIQLPVDVGLLDFGKPTKGAALALIARLRLIHASPLFNGGAAAAAYYGNWIRKSDGAHYVSQQYDESRWAVAAAAAKRVMDMGKYRLYTVPADERTPVLPAGVTTDPNFYGAYPNGALGIDALKSYSDVFTGESVAAINPEYIWGRNTDYLKTNISQGSMPPTLGGWGRFSVTQKVVDAYLMEDGRTKEEARGQTYFEVVADLPTGGTFDDLFTTQAKNFSGYPLNAGIFKMYANREMRFYASIGFNGAVWQALSSTTLNNHTAKYFYQEPDGRGGVSASSPNYPLTGYVIKKWNNSYDAFTGTGARHLPKAYPIIRYAEILLSYAEALNNLTGSHTVKLGEQTYTLGRDENEIKSSFNLVRYRAGLPGLSSMQLASKAEVQKQVERERMVEFLWENRRFYDVRRWGIYEETEREPIRGMNPDGADRESFYRRVSPGTSSFLTRQVDKKLIWVPIPRAEMRRLPSLDQNPGYN